MSDRDNQFVVDFGEKTTYGFHGIALNYFVEEVLKKRDDKKSKQLYFRLFRTGLIGDILYKNGSERIDSEEHSAENELLAALFESYVFLVRTIFDYLLHFLEDKYGVKDESFYDFVKKVKDGKYPEIKGKLREHIKKVKLFEEIRALRDSIKRQTPYISVYVKDNIYWVDGTIYGRDGGKKEDFDQPLRTLVFGYTSALLLLMSYMAESITGVSLKEQMEYQKRKSLDDSIE